MIKMGKHLYRTEFSPEGEALYAKASMALDEEPIREMIRLGLRQGNAAYLGMAFPAALKRIQERLDLISQVLGFAITSAQGGEIHPMFLEDLERYLKGDS